METKAIGDRTYKWFFEDNFVQDDNAPKDTIEIEATDFDEYLKVPHQPYISKMADGVLFYRHMPRKT